MEIPYDAGRWVGMALNEATVCGQDRDWIYLEHERLVDAVRTIPGLNEGYIKRNFGLGVAAANKRMAHLQCTDQVRGNVEKRKEQAELLKRSARSLALQNPLGK